METGKPPSKDISAEFMLAEYTTLRDFGSNTIALRESRLNFFLTTISGATVGIALINGVKGNIEIINFVSGVILVSMLFIGLITFRNTMKSNFQIVEYQRGLNRIRNYFVRENKSIEGYLLFSTHDDVPPFTTKFPIMTAIINSMIAGTGASLLAMVAISTQATWVYLIGIGIFGILFFSQYRYFITQAQKKERKTKVSFPSKQSN